MESIEIVLTEKLKGISEIVSLSDSISSDSSLFGAKASNLSRAIQMGFAVPVGVVISKLCTRETLESLAQDIVDMLGGIVAVRSSAVKEDSDTEAFAGMFETCLDVRTGEELLSAFDTVKSSGNSEHLKKYHGKAIDGEEIAVVIQSMVNSTRAGVAFSRDPLTSEKKVIIESNYGLGKSVVDGIVTPDSIEYINEEAKEIFIGYKSKQIIISKDGIEEIETKEEDTQKCSLSDGELQMIAELAREVEEKLGFPADIEWAFDSNNTLWLLQARPITTLKL
ncbi:MAG: PEP/pyruvate-binding domain-containing protein [Oscillospiraceae bacterium]|nr:PEP/pyruvate-binding domain-containing protein [Oscillospiraceae bacterium]